MRDDASGTVLDPALVVVAEVPATPGSQCIERAETKETVEIILRHPLMTGEPFAFPMLGKGVVLCFGHDKLFFAHVTLPFCSFDHA